MSSPWHIQLSDGTDTVKANCCDPSGAQQSLRFFQRVPLERTSMKLGSGRTQYSDLIAPWYSMSQDDYSGGRGGKNYLDDPSKYWDAKGVQSWIPRRLVLGPLVASDDSWKHTYGQAPDTSVALPFYDGAVLAQTFTPIVPTTLDEIDLYYTTADASGRSITAYIYDTSGGEPNAQMVQGSSALITGAGSGWITISFNNYVSLDAGTEYAIVFYSSSNGSGTVSVKGRAASQYTGAAWEWNGSGWDAHGTIADFSLRLPLISAGTTLGTDTDLVDKLPSAEGILYAQLFTLESAMEITGFQFEAVASSVTNRRVSGGLYSTSNGEPDTEIDSLNSEYLNGDYDDWLALSFHGGSRYTLAANTTYAIVFGVDYASGSGDIYFRGSSTEQYSGSTMWYWDQIDEWGTNTTAKTYAMKFGEVDNISDMHFFTYRGLMHLAASNGDYGSILSRRGHVGIATGATRTTLTDSTMDFTGWEHRVVRIVAGMGRGQWGVIGSVSGDTLTMTSGWDVVPDATSVYSSPGDWQFIEAIDAPITDVCVVDNVVYFACGPSEYMKRYSWTVANQDEDVVDDGTNTAEQLALFRDQENEPCIWRALGHEISNAAIQDYATDLTFNTAMRVGSSDSRISGMVVYDDHLYIGKHDGIYAIQEEIVRQVPVDFDALREESNCRGMVTWNLYLIFPLLEGLQRLYGTQVDDFGPNTGEGFPSGRQGTISAILPLPGALIVAVDGGPDNHSCVMLYNNLGWHEIARAEWEGQRIQALLYEAAPDGQIHLWWNEGLTLRYAWMSGRVFDRSRDSRADYCERGTLITGWLGTDLVDVTKLWDEVSIFGTGTTTVDYQLDSEDDGWTSASQTESGDTVRRFSLAKSEARQIRLRITLFRGDDGSTPVIDAITVDALGRVEQAMSYQAYVILDEMAVGLGGEETLQDSPSTILAKLDEWASDTTALTMTNALAEFSGKTVLLEPVAVKIEEWNEQNTKRVLTITLIEI